MLGLRAPSGKTGSKSVFNLPIANSLGLDRQESISLLKVHALKNPVAYSTERSKLFKQIVTNMVEINHNVIWNLLSTGQDESGTQFIKFDGKDFNPNVPDQEIAEISNSFAQTILKMWEKVFDDILPPSFADQADKKMSTVVV